MSGIYYALKNANTVIFINECRSDGRMGISGLDGM